jgi:hypothetical protein
MFGEPQRSMERKFEGKFSSHLPREPKSMRRPVSTLKWSLGAIETSDNFRPSNDLRCSFHMQLSRPR